MTLKQLWCDAISKISFIVGDWSDRDPKWSEVAESVKRAMGQNKLDDGEFWMEFFTDFCREFEEVSICTLGPDFNHDGIVDSSQVWNRFWKYAIGARLNLWMEN